MSKSSPNGSVPEVEQPMLPAATDHSQPTDAEYLHLLGEALRAARAQRGVTRKMLANNSGISERFLAQLESGTGNASVLVLRQISQALELPLDALLPKQRQQSAELEHAVELLKRLEPAELDQARQLLVHQLGLKNSKRNPRQRLALIGLRGAGKSTIGKLLAKKLSLPFIELDGLIEQTSGISLSMIFDLYGQSGFRRFERRCLDDLLSTHQGFVVATGGSLVSEPSTYDRLLENCYTIWLRAAPQEHMARVIAQGDMRPMAQNPEAMSDLERILKEREELYRRATVSLDTSGKSVEEVVLECLTTLQSTGGGALGKSR